MLRNIGTTEIIIIAVVILLLFGAKKLPEFAKGLTAAKKEFKDGFSEEEKAKTKNAKKKE